MARAAKLEGFIRHGCKKAHIEIELKGDPENYTIRRVFEGNSSTWTVNGMSASNQVVKELVESLNIDTDNLCNFLPQERVPEFAALTKKELLEKTMLTVGGKDMLEQFSALCQLRKKETKMQDDVREMETQIQNLQQRNVGIQAEVQRYQQREEILQRIRLLERKKPWVEYSHYRDFFMNIKEQRRQALPGLTELRDRCAPMREEYDQSQVAVQEMTTARDLANADCRKLQQKVSDLRKQVDDNVSSD